MSVKKWQINSMLDDWFYNHSVSERLEFEQKMSINWEECTPEEKYGIAKAWINITDKEESIATIDRWRLEDFKKQVAIETFRAKALATIAEKITDYLKEIGTILKEGNEKNTERLDVLVASTIENYKNLKSEEPSKKIYLLPPHIEYADCWRRHDPSEHSPEGRPGPTQCVQTFAKEDGIHYRCIVAYAAQNPGDSGFARLNYQIFHAELLRQGNCPKPLSRSITRRIPVVSWVFTKPDVCPLATGLEYVLEKDGKLHEVSD